MSLAEARLGYNIELVEAQLNLARFLIRKSQRGFARQRVARPHGEGIEGEGKARGSGRIGRLPWWPGL